LFESTAEHADEQWAMCRPDGNILWYGFWITGIVTRFTAPAAAVIYPFHMTQSTKMTYSRQIII